MADSKIYNDEVLYFFDELVLNSGDFANRTTILSGGSLIVEAGGIANSTSIEVDSPYEGIRELIVRGTANEVRNKGGTVEVFDGGSAWTLTVSDLGILAVEEGGSAVDVTIEDQGILRLSAGGSVSNVTVEDGGALILENGASTTRPILQEGGIFGYDFNCSLLEEQDGILVNVLNAGESENYRIQKESVQVVGDGLVSRSATVQTGGVQQVLAGGTAEGTQVEKGGSLIVERGGTAVNITVSQSSDISYDFGTTVQAETTDTGSRIISTADSSYNYSVTTRRYRLPDYLHRGQLIQLFGYDASGCARRPDCVRRFRSEERRSECGGGRRGQLYDDPGGRSAECPGGGKSQCLRGFRGDGGRFGRHCELYGSEGWRAYGAVRRNGQQCHNLDRNRNESGSGSCAGRNHARHRSDSGGRSRDSEWNSEFQPD